MSGTIIPPFAARTRIAAEFDHPDVVTTYRYRPEPPAQTFDILGGLIADEPRVVLWTSAVARVSWRVRSRPRGPA